MNQISTTREAYSFATLAAEWRVVGRQDHAGKWRYVVPPEPLRLGADRGEVSLVTRREADGSFALLGRRLAPIWPVPTPISAPTRPHRGRHTASGRPPGVRHPETPFRKISPEP